MIGTLKWNMYTSSPDNVMRKHSLYLEAFNASG